MSLHPCVVEAGPSFETRYIITLDERILSTLQSTASRVIKLRCTLVLCTSIHPPVAAMTHSLVPPAKHVAGIEWVPSP
jgi:hypothetical protein